MKDYRYICINCGSLFKIRRHTGYSTTGCTGLEITELNDFQRMNLGMEI